MIIVWRKRQFRRKFWNKKNEKEKSNSMLTPSRASSGPGMLIWEPLFATSCCNTSRATWSTPSEPPPRKPFFEVLSFSALFGTGCCCQLICFEFGVLHFRLPLYTRNGQVGEHVLLLWFLALVLAGCCCQLVCFEFVVLHFRLPIPETGRL